MIDVPLNPREFLDNIGSDTPAWDLYRKACERKSGWPEHFYEAAIVLYFMRGSLEDTTVSEVNKVAARIAEVEGKTHSMAIDSSNWSKVDWRRMQNEIECGRK